MELWKNQTVDAYTTIVTKRDIRSFSDQGVPEDMQLKVLEAARMAGTGKNVQHSRFILIRDRENLSRLADVSTSGKWVRDAAFAVIVLTDPAFGFHKLDGGRAAEDMQLAAWSMGIVSCIFTGFREDALREAFDVPEDLSPSVVVGFGYPTQKVTGRRKNRKPLRELAFIEKFGSQL